MPSHITDDIGAIIALVASGGARQFFRAMSAWIRRLGHHETLRVTMRARMLSTTGPSVCLPETLGLGVLLQR